MKSYADYELIYSVIMSIPRGKVATYGQVAELAGLPGRARQVGYALRALEDDRMVPWHRVINAAGKISTRSNPQDERDQQSILEGEGIEFDEAGRLSLARYRWDPK